MAKKRIDDTPRVKRKRLPAVTIEGRENQLISLAVDEAEKRIENGTASDSLLIHYLRQGTTRMQLEKAKLEAEIELSRTKADSLNESRATQEMYEQAMKAFQVYTGNGSDEDYED